ncbi:MAG: hypothetical protein EBZ74_04950 [Planctomycetia bacterium]|nr:hypothetical protein [Planctomycetia bacterium]
MPDAVTGDENVIESADPMACTVTVPFTDTGDPIVMLPLDVRTMAPPVRVVTVPPETVMLPLEAVFVVVTSERLAVSIAALTLIGPLAFTEMLAAGAAVVLMKPPSTTFVGSADAFAPMATALPTPAREMFAGLIERAPAPNWSMPTLIGTATEVADGLTLKEPATFVPLSTP